MTLDETKGNQDNQPSEDLKGTSENDPETLTEEDRTKKAVSDALSAAGRTDKDVEAKLKKANEAASKAEKLMLDIKAENKRKAEQDYQEELRKADGDVIAIRNIKLAKGLKEVQAELGDTKTELGKSQEELTDARKVAAVSTKERNAREIASKYEVDSKTLLLTDGSAESMEALAKQISGKVIPTLKPNGSKTIGGSASFEKIRDEMIKNPSNDAKMRAYLEAKKAREG